MDDGSNHAPAAPAPGDHLLDADTASVVLSDTEKLVLQLYHQVRELELERSLLEAQQNGTACPAATLPASCPCELFQTWGFF